jgi:hypothetical protein
MSTADLAIVASTVVEVTTIGAVWSLLRFRWKVTVSTPVAQPAKDAPAETVAAIAPADQFRKAS